MKTALLAALVAMSFPVGAWQLIGAEHPLAGRWVGNGDGNPLDIHDALTFYCDVGAMPGMPIDGRYSDVGPNFFCVGISRHKAPADGRATHPPVHWNGYLYELSAGYYGVAWNAEIPPPSLITVIADKDFSTLSAKLLVDQHGNAENSAEGSTLFRAHKGFDPGEVYGFLKAYER